MHWTRWSVYWQSAVPSRICGCLLACSAAHMQNWPHFFHSSVDVALQATCRANSMHHAVGCLRDVLQVLQNSGLDLSQLDVYEQLEFVPFDPTVKRTEGTLKGPDGKVFKTTKGECTAVCTASTCSNASVSLGACIASTMMISPS
jgi:hypothetical protein